MRSRAERAPGVEVEDDISLEGQICLPARHDDEAPADPRRMEMALPRVAPIVLGRRGADDDGANVESGGAHARGRICVPGRGRVRLVDGGAGHDLRGARLRPGGGAELAKERGDLVGERAARKRDLDPFHGGIMGPPWRTAYTEKTATPASPTSPRSSSR